MAASSSFENARALVELRRYVEAEKALGAHLALDPQDARALRLLAFALHKQGRTEPALEACIDAGNIDAENTSGLVLLANLHRELGHHELAMEAATRAVRGAPHDWSTYFTRARIQLDPPNPQPAGALSDSLKAVQLAPNEPQARNILAMSYTALGQVSRARDSYETALSMDPGNVWALNNLAILSMRRGRLSGAATALRSGLAHDPQLRHLHKNIDVLLLHLLSRLSLINTLAGVSGALLLLVRGAPSSLRMGLGSLALCAVGVAALRSTRHLPGGRLGILHGFWSRSGRSAHVLMMFWVLTGVCMLCICFAPTAVAEPAAGALITANMGVGTMGMLARVSASAVRRHRS